MGRHCLNIILLVGPAEAQKRFIGQYTLPGKISTEIYWKEDVLTLPAGVTAFEHLGCLGVDRLGDFGRCNVNGHEAAAIRVTSYKAEPEVLLLRLSRSHPELEMRLEYDSDFTDTFGQWSFRNGEILGRRLYDYHCEFGDGLRGKEPLWPWITYDMQMQIFGVPEIHHGPV